MLRHTLAALCCAAALLSGAAADSNGTGPLSSRQILPDNFKPPQVWDVEKLERSVNLEKIYAKEEWTLMVKNSAKEPQEHFYIPFEAGTISRIGAFEAYEKGSKVQGFSKKFNSEVVALDSDRSVYHSVGAEGCTDRAIAARHNSTRSHSTLRSPLASQSP